MSTTTCGRAPGALRRAAAFAALATLALVATPFGLLPAPAEAAAELRVVCPGGKADPYFKNTNNGRRVEIVGAQNKAFAKSLCNNTALGEATQTTTVNIVNSRNTTLYVGFTNDNHQPGNITWGAGCTANGSGAAVAAGKTCVATVENDNTPTRFCGSTSGVPADCFDAQTNHQTMVETNFQPSSAGGCFGKGSCVWFDISVIPSTCTDADWTADECAGTGGASYNLPVSISCSTNTIYTCQGPQTSKYGSANYPSNCGNPNATCSGNNEPACLNAYFYPMSGMNPQPNTVCLSAAPLMVNFLSGQ